MFLIYGPILLLDQFQINLFLLALWSSIAQLLSLIPFNYLTAHYSRASSQMLLMVINTFFTYVCFFLARDDCFTCSSGPKFIIIIVSFFITRFASSLACSLCSVSLNETFPAQIRSIGIYSVVAIGRIVTILVPYLTTIKANLHTSLLEQYGMVGLLGIISISIIR